MSVLAISGSLFGLPEEAEELLLAAFDMADRADRASACCRPRCGVDAALVVVTLCFNEFGREEGFPFPSHCWGGRRAFLLDLEPRGVSEPEPASRPALQVLTRGELLAAAGGDPEGAGGMVAEVLLRLAAHMGGLNGVPGLPSLEAAGEDEDDEDEEEGGLQMQVGGGMLRVAHCAAGVLWMRCGCGGMEDAA
jgi:hypothetical protein